MSTITAEELERRRRLGVERVARGTRKPKWPASWESLARCLQWVKAARIGPRGFEPNPDAVVRQSLRHNRNCKCCVGSRSRPRLRLPQRVVDGTTRSGSHPPQMEGAVPPAITNEWLAERRVTPQKPRRQPRERDDEAIRHWVRYVWPSIKNNTATAPPPRPDRRKRHVDGTVGAPHPRAQRADARPEATRSESRKGSLDRLLCLSPVKRRLSLHFRTYPKQYVNNVRAVEFLRALLRQLRGPILVVWDRGNMHKGDPIRELLRRVPPLGTPLATVLRARNSIRSSNSGTTSSTIAS